jgi:hypothetical protein
MKPAAILKPRVRQDIQARTDIMAQDRASFGVASAIWNLDNSGLKAPLKPANAKAQALLIKLQALAEQGIDGEKTSAQGKIARLKASFDFTVPGTAMR